MWETSKITNAGLSLFASWLQGTNLTITKAAGGSGTSDDIAALTALTNQKQVASITSYSRDGNKFSVKLRFPTASQAYTLNQIGIFAQLDNGAETLIAVYQDDDGVNIPASGEFYYGFAAVIAYSNEGTLTVTVDGSEYVTAEELEAALVNKQSTISASGILKGTGNGIVSATAGTDYQSPTQTLTVEESMADADSMPFYKSSASSHRRITWAKIKALFTALFDTKYATKTVETSKQDRIQLTGILKGTGTGISAAQSGTDYQLPTQSLTAETEIVDADTLPFFDQSAAGSRKITWAKIKETLKTLFDTSYAAKSTETSKQDRIQLTGILKGNGTSVTTASAGADYQSPTQLLTEEVSLADDDTIPFYDKSVSNSRKTTWGNIKALLKTITDSLYAAKSVETSKQDKILLTGLLKGNGTSVVIATADNDYQQATKSLAAENAIVDADTLPFYDQSAAESKKVSFGEMRNKMRPSCYYAVSLSDESAVGKVASCDDFLLKKGCIVTVKFDAANIAESPTLNVGSSGAAPIVSPGEERLNPFDYWLAGDYVEFQYDGEKWVQLARFGSVSGVETGSYRGNGNTGADNKRSLTFRKQPKMLVVMPQSPVSAGSNIYVPGFTVIRNVSMLNVMSSSTGSVMFSWDDKTVSWWSNNDANTMQNKNNTTYHWIAYT